MGTGVKIRTELQGGGDPPSVHLNSSSVGARRSPRELLRKTTETAPHFLVGPALGCAALPYPQSRHSTDDSLTTEFRNAFLVKGCDSCH